MERFISFNKYQHLLKKIPLAVWISSGGVLLVIILSIVLFFMPKQVQFAYAADSCTSALVIAPQLQKSTSSQFEVTAKDEWRIGPVVIASTKLCVQPKQAPQEGSYTATIAPGGGWFAARPITIDVPPVPTIKAETFTNRSISTALPFNISLSQKDTTHHYDIKVGDAVASCTPQDDGVSCPVASLQLAQGSQYTAQVLRSFKGSEKIKVAEGAIATLVPIHVTERSLTDNQTVYDIPKAFTFSFDLPVASVSAQLTTREGKPIPITATAHQHTVSIVPTEPLPRKTQYTLTISQVVSTEGNALASPLNVPFSTSGGPKVANVSVGATNVSRDARIVITLDQPVSDDTDITQRAHIAGVQGVVTKLSSTQLAFTLQGAGLCQAFTLTLDKGLKSGSNNELSDEPWNFSARTICGYSSVIGYSVKGRPIVAYYFGNGSNTLLFTGGIHGEERSGQQTMQAWADYLMANGQNIPADKRVVIVPNLNPDGIAAGTRNNANNVNLGRNYPSYNWQASIDTASGTLPTGGGTSAGSEPETQAIMALTRQLQPRLEVSFHAQGRLVGANKVKDSVVIGDMYARTVGYSTMYDNAEEVMGYSITGEYEEWMGESLGIPAILIELPTRQGSYLTSQLAALMKLLSL